MVFHWTKCKRYRCCYEQFQIIPPQLQGTQRREDNLHQFSIREVSLVGALHLQDDLNVRTTTSSRQDQKIITREWKEHHWRVSILVITCGVMSRQAAVGVSLNPVWNVETNSLPYFTSNRSKRSVAMIFIVDVDLDNDSTSEVCRVLSLELLTLKNTQ